MENSYSVRRHTCARNHSWYTDLYNDIKFCPVCTMPPCQTHDPCEESYDHVGFDHLLLNYGAAAIATNDRFFTGWAGDSKVRYWTLVILSRVERLGGTI